MQVTMLFVEGCAGSDLARQRLHEAAARVGIDESVIVCQVVRSSADAERLAFKGSPTILIDGRDPFPGGVPGAGLTCRLYPGSTGPDQAPSVEQLAAALRG